MPIKCAREVSGIALPCCHAWPGRGAPRPPPASHLHARNRKLTLMGLRVNCILSLVHLSFCLSVCLPLSVAFSFCLCVCISLAFFNVFAPLPLFLLPLFLSLPPLSPPPSLLSPFLPTHSIPPSLFLSSSPYLPSSLLIILFASQ